MDQRRSIYMYHCMTSLGYYGNTMDGMPLKDSNWPHSLHAVSYRTLIVHLSVLCNRKHGTISYAANALGNIPSSEFFRQNDHKQSIVSNTTIALVRLPSCYFFLHLGSSRTYCFSIAMLGEKFSRMGQLSIYTEAAVMEPPGRHVEEVMWSHYKLKLQMNWRIPIKPL